MFSSHFSLLTILSRLPCEMRSISHQGLSRSFSSVNLLPLTFFRLPCEMRSISHQDFSRSFSSVNLLPLTLSRCSIYCSLFVK